MQARTGTELAIIPIFFKYLFQKILVNLLGKIYFLDILIGEKGIEKGYFTFCNFQKFLSKLIVRIN